MKKLLLSIVASLTLLSAMMFTVHATGNGALSATSATGVRGDTVTVAVNLATNPGLATLRIQITYPAGITLQSVSNAGILNGWTNPSPTISSPYTLRWADSLATENNTVTGTIATLTFHIDDSASIGANQISIGVIESRDTNGGKNNIAGTSATITVNCVHSYGSWTKQDDNNHVRICSICSGTETQAHTWNAGTVEKQATCKETGLKRYTCTTCNATKTEEIAKTTTHTWGNWLKVNDSQHKRTCSVCSQEEAANHRWNNGTVTKAATCKEVGIKTYSCTDCNAEKTEEIAKSTTHTYGAWERISDTEHKHTCTVCGTATETKSHTWNNGTVTKAATCKEVGIKTYTCTGCNAEKTEEIAKTTTHTFGAWEKINDDQHKRTCTVCGTETETANHTWNTGVVAKAATCKETGIRTYTCTGCGATKTADIEKTTDHRFGAWTKSSDTEHKRVCSVCDKEETQDHSYSTVWQSDVNGHYHLCSVCGDKKDSTAHTPGAAATESTPQTCTTCGYIITPALGHTHVWASEWTTDESGHWYTCSGCNEKKDASEHVYDNGCDPDCNVCGFTRTTEHQFEMKSDETSHWQECKVCGETKEKEDHVPGQEATATDPQVCLVCGYVIEPAKGEPETDAPETEEDTKGDETVEPTEGDTNEPVETEPQKGGSEVKDGGSPLPWILGGIGVLAVAGLIIFFLLRKKKKEAE